MLIQDISDEKLREYNDNLLKYIETDNALVKTLYLDLGVKTVRLLCYCREFIPHIKKQLAYTLRENAESFDATVILWKENNFEQIYRKIMPDNLRLRVELLALKEVAANVSVFNKDFSVSKPVLSIEGWHKTIYSFDKESNTYFFGTADLNPEVLVKEGHLFVQILNNILKTENTNLVHGACIGLDNEGILLCARGQRGKSTLAVLAMMQGFEYVSDDYLTLEKDGENLYAHPIYSIITLSPKMYNELYDKLEGTRFVSNNARKDKYVINIANFHHQFKNKYPIKLCMFPEIVSDKEPSIKKSDKREKGRTVTHLIHSTIFQMKDIYDIKTVQKLIKMIEKYEFYKINLCNDIYKNVECLKQFMKEYKNG